jgi:hypothetical protein
MKKIILKSFCLSAVIALFVIVNASCAKDDSPRIELEDGGTVTRFQLVNITVANAAQETYQATFAGNPVNVSKIDDTTVGFLVSDNVDFGENILEIPGLNKKVKYLVNPVVLTSSVENTLDNLVSNFTNFTNDLGDSPDELYVISSVTNFSDALDQMSSEDQETIAKVYQANKVFFDTMYSVDYSIPQGRSSDFSNLSNRQLAVNFGLATIGAGIATAGAWMAIPNPLISLPFAIAAIPLWLVTKDLLNEIVVERVWVYTKFQWGELVSNFSNRSSLSSSYLEFVTAESQLVPLSYEKRGFTSSDANVTQEGVAAFFSSFNKANFFIDQLNEVITLVNSLPFINIPLLSNETLGTPNIANANSNASIFGNMTISASHPNLQVNTPTFSNGGVNFTFTIIDPTVVDEFIETSISYTFNDDFNSGQESIPIRVYKVIEDPKLISATILGYENVGVGGCNQNATVVFRLNFNTSTPTTGSISGMSTWVQNGNPGSGNPFQFPIGESFEIGSNFVIVKRPCCWTLPGDTIGRKFNYVNSQGVATNEIYIFVPRP